MKEDCAVQDDHGYPGTFEQYILDSGLDVPVAGLQPVEMDDTQARTPRGAPSSVCFRVLLNGGGIFLKCMEPGTPNER